MQVIRINNKTISEYRDWKLYRQEPYNAVSILAHNIVFYRWYKGIIPLTNKHLVVRGKRVVQYCWSTKTRDDFKLVNNYLINYRCQEENRKKILL